MVTTYILGGPPRAGKSNVQQLMLERYGIPGISTDLLREGFIYGVPEFGIKRDEAGQTDNERSHILWPYFKGLLVARKYYDTKLLIEGTNLLPEYLQEFKDTSYIKMCFLGFTEIDIQEKVQNIKSFKSTDSEWTDKMNDQELYELAEHLIELSEFFKDECKKYDIPYFDTSKGFTNVIHEVAEYLLSG